MLCFEKPQGFNLSERKMSVKKKEKQTKAQTGAQSEPPAEAENASAEDFPRELRLNVWSVVSFEKCEAGGLTYAEAEQKLSSLKAQKVSGLCIVTDEAAARIHKKN
jgi:hypothetical protein